MSKNAFNLSREAIAVFKAQPKPVPVQDPIDEFDNFDEMFLQLNNALIEKRDELKELQEKLDKKETELELKERDIDNQEADLINTRKEQKKYHIQLAEKEKQIKDLDKKEEDLDNEKKNLEQKIKKLNDALAEQRELEAHLRDKIFKQNYNTPWIMFEIPPANGSTNLRFITKLNTLGSKEIYSQTQSLIYPIDKRLRELYTRAKTDRDEDKQIKIAATYYLMSFSYDTYLDIALTLERYISFLEELEDKQLDAMAKELKEKPLARIRDLAEG